MMKLVGFDTFTYRGYVKECQGQVEKHEEDLRRARERLTEAQIDLDRVRPLGLADTPLPKNYGSILLARQVINGSRSRDEVADNVKQLVDEMTAGQDHDPGS